MSITEKKREQLLKRMSELEVKEGDLEEKFILAPGKGGQKVQKTASCVFLKHLPTQITVKCSRERSRDLNRHIARNMLCDKLEEAYYPERSKKQKAIEKIKKQKQRRKRRQKTSSPEVSREPKP